MLPNLLSTLKASLEPYWYPDSRASQHINGDPTNLAVS